MRLAAEGCKTCNHVTNTYVWVVYHKGIITFAYTALNDLNVWTADVQHTYLHAPHSENYYTMMGNNFGSEF